MVNVNYDSIFKTTNKRVESKFQNKTASQLYCGTSQEKKKK